jgi:hypothetical protein
MGHDGTKCCIYIGELTSTWTYTQIFVTDFQAGFSGLSASNWRSGWDVGFEASAFGTITYTETNPQINNWARNGQDLYYGSGTGSVGIGTNTPGTKLDVSSDIRTATRYLISTGTTNENMAIGYWDSANARIEAGAALPMLITSYQGNIKLGISGGTTMTIQSSNVGIGVTAPLSPLTVKANVGASALRFVGRSSDGISGIDFFNSTQTVGNYFQSNGSWMRARADGGFHFSKGSTPITTDVDGFTIAGMNVGIGTESPPASAKLTVMGNQTFGLPGNGANTSGRFISIEGNTDGSGEGSGRVFFTEHNSSTGLMDNYGMSLGYRGGATSIVGASGNTWTGLTQIGNGQWGMWGHNNNAAGSLVMFGDRAATYVSIPPKVGINNTNPNAYLRVDGTTTVTAARFYGTGGTRPPLELRQNNTAGWFAKFYSDNFGTYIGGISFYGSSTTFNTSSDYRLKENIIPISDSITRLKQLKPSRFNFKQYPEITIDGFLAHEVQDIVPEAVTGDKDELDLNGKPVYQAIDHSRLIPLLVAAIQELEARVKELENK